jgi:hypothetical protein
MTSALIALPSLNAKRNNVPLPLARPFLNLVGKIDVDAVAAVLDVLLPVGFIAFALDVGLARGGTRARVGDGMMSLSVMGGLLPLVVIFILLSPDGWYVSMVVACGDGRGVVLLMALVAAIFKVEYLL